MIIKGYKIYPKQVKYEYNIVKTKFNLDISYIKYIQDSSRKPIIRSSILQNQIESRIIRISKDYDDKVNKILDTVIMNSNLENYPIENLSRLVTSIMRVTKSLSNSLTSIIIGLEDIK